MVDFVVDKSLDVLLRQLNEHAPGRDKSSDGSIGDTAHQTRTSAHNPEDTADSSDGNDPDNQVDARDFTHDPAHGADMNVMTEDIRLSRDRRVELVIWNRRQFSSYSTSSRRAWEWGAYSGTNDHTKHAHAQTNDRYNDDLTPWKVFTMADTPALTTTEWRLWHFLQLNEVFNNHVNNEAEKAPAVTLLKRVDQEIAELKTLAKAQAEQILLLTQIIQGLSIPAPAPVDPDTVKLAMLDPVVLAAFANAVQDEGHRRSAA